MGSEKEELKRLLLTHLNREIMYLKERNIEIFCENFGSFYGEGRDPKCLLDEYCNKDGRAYFSIDEAREICRYFRMEKETKCENDGHFIPGKIPLQIELENLLNKFRKRAETEKEKIFDKSL